MIRTTALLLVLAAFGCSGSGRVHTTYAYHADQDPVTNESVHVVPGDMPASETYTGSYHSPQIGDVYLEQTGDTVVGSYEYDRAACHATGHIEGSLQGNLLHFNWTESQAECGRLAPLSGRGYFLLWQQHNNDGTTDARINGEWGTGENDSGGGPWSGMRDRVRRHPQQRTPSNSGGSVFEDANGSSSGSSGGSGSSGSSSPRKR